MNHAPTCPIETLLADLWSYGIAGMGAAPVPASRLPETAESWGAAAQGGGDDLAPLPPPAFHRVSVPLRRAVADLGIVMADGRVLGAMAAFAQGGDVAQDRVLVLPPLGANESFAQMLTPAARARVARRRLLLREARRQTLGLAAVRPAVDIEAAIHAAYVVPAVQRLFDSLHKAGTGGRVWVTAKPRAIAHFFAPLVLRADDPLSDNVFALAMRTGFFGPNARAFRPFLALSPARFGRLVRAARPPDQGLQTAALAIAQINLLWPAEPLRPSVEKGLSHV